MNEIPRVDKCKTEKIVVDKKQGTDRNIELVSNIAGKLLEEYGFEYENELQVIKAVLKCDRAKARDAYFRGVITQEEYNKLYRKAYGIDTE